MEFKYTWVINTHKNILYLKLAIESIRKNAYYKNQPIIVFCENDKESHQWLIQQSDIKTIYQNNEIPVGIGGGINIAMSHVETEFVNLLHSDMWISKNYDKPLLDIISQSTEPTVASAWRLEPNIWNQPDRLGTTMAPANADDGFGVYYHDFQSEAFEAWADEFAKNNFIRFRKVEGVSYMMRTKDFIPNDSLFAPSSFEDMDQFIHMAYNNYNLVETSEAVVWHFGSRGANFMEQPDKITGRSERQLKAERDNAIKWKEKWGEMPTFDQYGFIVLTDGLKKRYTELYG